MEQPINALPAAQPAGREEERADVVAWLRAHAELHDSLSRERPLVDGRLDEIAREHRMIAVRTRQNADAIESGDHIPPQAVPQAA